VLGGIEDEVEGVQAKENLKKIRTGKKGLILAEAVKVGKKKGSKMRPKGRAASWG